MIKSRYNLPQTLFGKQYHWIIQVGKPPDYIIISIFNAPSIGSDLVVAVLLYEKRDTDNFISLTLQ